MLIDVDPSGPMVIRNRYDMAVHENAHHVYHANTGRHSRNHPDAWSTIEDNKRNEEEVWGPVD